MTMIRGFVKLTNTSGTVYRIKIASIRYYFQNDDAYSMVFLKGGTNFRVLETAEEIDKLLG